LTGIAGLFYLCSMHWTAIRSYRHGRPTHRVSQPLAALDRVAPKAAAQFRRWRGRSGQGYVVSVYPIEACPDYIDAIALAVSGSSGRAVWIGETGDGGEAFRRNLLHAARAGASEVHIHLLADDARERRSAIEDLRVDAPSAPRRSGLALMSAAAGQVRALHQEGRHAEC